MTTDQPHTDTDASGVQSLGFFQRLYKITEANLRQAFGMATGAALAVDTVFVVVAMIVYAMGVGPTWFAIFLAVVGAVGVAEKILQRVR